MGKVLVNFVSNSTTLAASFYLFCFLRYSEKTKMCHFLKTSVTFLFMIFFKICKYILIATFYTGNSNSIRFSFRRFGYSEPSSTSFFLMDAILDFYIFELVLKNPFHWCITTLYFSEENYQILQKIVLF